MKDKELARKYFYNIRQAFIDWNYKKWQSQDFKTQEDKIDQLLKEDSYEKSMH